MPTKTFLCLCVAFVLGVALGIAPWAALPIALVCLILLLFASRGHTLPILALCVAAFAVGLLRGGTAGGQLADIGRGPWRARAVTTVERTASGQYKGKVRLEPGGAVVMMYSETEWTSHDGIAFAGSVADPLRALNPGEFDYQALLERQGVAAVVFADSLDVVAQYRPGLIDDMRDFLLRSLSVLKTPERALAQALVLGDRRLLDDAVRDSWRKAGASHLLAVSGLHVSIVGGAIFVLMRRRFGLRASSLAATLTVVLYATVIGYSMSAWRAALTFALVALAGFALRRQHWPTTVALVAATLLAISPLAIADPGFQLSFAAAVGIMHLSPLLAGMLPRTWPRSIALLCSASLAAQIATVPIIVIHFSAVPLYGMMSSLFLIPLAPALLVLALVTAFLGQIPVLGPAMAGLFSLMTLPFTWVTSSLASLPLSTVNALAAPWPLLAVYYAVLFGIPSFSVSRMQRLAALSLALVMVLLVPGLLLLGQYSVTFLAVGNADSIHIRAGASHLLVDTADATAMQRSVLPYLASQGVNRLRTVFISHSHRDHVGGLPGLLGGMVVDRIISGPETGEVRQVAGGVEVIAARMGMVVQGRGYNVRLLMAEKDSLSLNNRSAAMLVRCGNLKVVLAADLEREAEAVLHVHLPRADVLKVAHHGSASSTTAVLLEAVTPSLAVVSVGANRYGHPANVVLDRLESSGASVLRTDESGAVRIIARRKHLLVYGFQRGRFVLLGRYALTGRGVSGDVIGWQLSGATTTCQAA